MQFLATEVVLFIKLGKKEVWDASETIEFKSLPNPPSERGKQTRKHEKVSKGNFRAFYFFYVKIEHFLFENKTLLLFVLKSVRVYEDED
jgi:hypothetical protein